MKFYTVYVPSIWSIACQYTQKKMVNDSDIFKSSKK
jgi:hypothetical protein